ncbi:hypothetical protein HXZ27_14320 [Micromonospora carbonacea subsp. aurantiaca]|uniref:Uncharacterized protein n=1 Tax=Micromonospora carbonacea TaxID=47853 RepID=A0A7H8XN55_9ACTN|nr:hypothetical protein HXZ27_14320 [Micromonospora carbonacea]
MHTSAVAGTHALYQCQVGSDRFTSLSAGCEGKTFLGVIGYVYDAPPAAPSQVFYRCRVRSNGEHFDSPDANCEGQIAEGSHGYLLL